MKKIFILLVIILFFSCEKEENDSVCYDCIIKQSNNIEYPATYCGTEKDISQLINYYEEAKCGVKIICHRKDD